MWPENIHKQRTIFSDIPIILNYMTIVLGKYLSPYIDQNTF